MSKSQFKYNPEEIHFKKLDNGFRQRLWKVLAYLFAAFFIAILLNIGFLLLFDSPGERIMKNENKELQRQYQLLLERKETVDTVFREIQRTDENIFRLIFETEPAISQATPNTHFSYEELKKYSDREIVMETSGKLDSMLYKVKFEKLNYDILRIKSEDRADLLTHIPAIQPIENHDLSRTASGYGYRLHPIYKIHKMHTGMDYTAPIGTPVMATGDGVIEKTQRSRRGSGNLLIIDHGFGYKTKYAHLNDIKTWRGREVKRGDIIGTVGNTGLSAGPHLHYEVIIHNEPVNPVNYYFLELSPIEYDKMIMLSKNSGQSFD